MGSGSVSGVLSGRFWVGGVLSGSVSGVLSGRFWVGVGVFSGSVSGGDCGGDCGFRFCFRRGNGTWDRKMGNGEPGMGHLKLFGGGSEPQNGETKATRANGRGACQQGLLVSSFRGGGETGQRQQAAAASSSSTGKRNLHGEPGAAQQQAAAAQAHKLTRPTSPKPGCLLVSSLLVSRENQVGLGVGILLKRWTESRIWVWGFRVSACQHGTYRIICRSKV